MKQGWQIKKLGEVCIKCNNIKWDVIEEGDSFLYIDLTSVDRDDLCIHNPQTINRDNAPSRAKQIVRTDDVIFATTRPTLRRVSLIGEKHNNAICSTGFCVLRSNKEILPQFVFYALQGDDFYKYIEPLQTGASYPAVTDGVVKNFSIPVPPLSEQQRIVALLDAEFAKIDALKANAEKNLQNAKDLFQAALKKELEPKEGWKTMHLNEVASYSIGLTYKPDNVNQNGIIVLRSSNIQNDELDLNDIVRVDCVIKEELYVREGDILMCSRNGSRRLVGKVAKIGVTKERMTFGTFMTIIRSDYNPILFYFFKTKSFRNQLETGENPMINQITKYMLNDVVVSIPSSLTEQDTVVARLDALSEKCKTLQANYEKTLSLCDGLKQALLRKAFNGEI